MTSLPTIIKTNYLPAKNLDPFFEIKRCPLKTELNGVEVQLDRDGLFSPNNDLMGIVSPKYQLIKNADVRDLFDEFFNKLKIYSITDKVSNNGNRWMREYVLDEDKYSINIDNDDLIKTKITIVNGYDGKTAVGMVFSAWRQICSNGMMGWKKIIGRKFGHFSKNILNQLNSTINIGFNGMSDNFEKWRKWSEIEFTEKQFNSFINDRKYLSDKQKKLTNNLYAPIMKKFNEKETRWGAYNVLTAIATHYTTSRNTDVANDFSNGFKTITRITKDFYNIETGE